MNATEDHHEHEDYHLVANEVVFQVRHPADDPAKIKERILGALEEFLNQSPNDTLQGEGYEKPLVEGYWRKRLEPVTERLITFSSLTQSDNSERFSLVPLKLIDHPEGDFTPDDVLNFLNKAYFELRDKLIVLEGKDYRHMPIKLSENDPEIRLKSISPNFLAGGAYHSKPTGGPGSLPTSSPAPSHAQRRFKLKGPLDSLSAFRHPGAQIAILDTAQPLTNFPADIQDIFLADPSMEVLDYPNQAELDGLADYGQRPDHYDMNDHGTFIASIIRSITPSAKIYLYQMLNRFGDGSMTTVSQALVAAINQRGQEATPLIINCSFGLEDELPDRPDLETLSEPSTQQLIFTSMRDAFAWVAEAHPDVVVVASAGNDAKDGQPRPSPRSPAKLDKVLGVAAVPRGLRREPAKGNKFKPASYSNRAYSVSSAKDQAYSFATVGGERQKNPPYSSRGGPLGVYIGVIPQVNPDGTFSQVGSPNPTGWARWSGTSFAAPIITALLAAQDNELKEGRPLLPSPHRTFDDEQLIPVRQG